MANYWQTIDIPAEKKLRAQQERDEIADFLVDYGGNKPSIRECLRQANQARKKLLFVVAARHLSRALILEIDSTPQRMNRITRLTRNISECLRLHARDNHRPAPKPSTRAAMRRERTW